MTNTPSVWVGCLACYNGGALEGAWFDAIDCPQDMDEFNEAIRVPGLHQIEAHEELWVFDFEGFHGLLTGECSPVTAKELADVLDSVYEPEAFAAYVSNELGLHYASSDWDAAKESFDDAYCGKWASGEDYAEVLAGDIGAIDPKASWPLTHIDWEGAWRDLTFDGYADYPASGGNVYIFRST